MLTLGASRYVHVPMVMLSFWRVRVGLVRWRLMHCLAFESPLE